MPDISNLHIILILIILVVSLFILSKSADLLVDNAVKLSKIWGLSEVVIGATIVSLGTTLPELAASVISAVQGNGEFSVGNAIGSCITNTSLILGVALLFGIIPVRKRQTQKLTIFIIATLLLTIPLVISYFVLGSFKIPQWLGIVMLVILPFYMAFLVIQEKKNPVTKEELEDEEKEIEEEKPKQKIIVLLLLLLVAALLIAVSASFLVDSAEVIALRIGIPDAIIASTLVAFGTSVPELSTAIAATKSKHGGLALGNVLGANILNILFVIGISSVLTVGGIVLSIEFVLINFIALALIIILFSIIAYNGKINKISKREGIILLIFYIAYVIANLLSI
ncbi:MAG: calcium/sodium antiporter [Bacilli bacterium]|nr:calcium/sodium antiporter [Bacilli bacterium]